MAAVAAPVTAAAVSMGIWYPGAVDGGAGVGHARARAAWGPGLTSCYNEWIGVVDGRNDVVDVSRSVNGIDNSIICT